MSHLPKNNLTSVKGKHFPPCVCPHKNKNKLKDMFGVMGVELWEHANGIDLSVISDLERKEPDKSYSNSQVLFKDYNGENVKIIIKEMVDVVARRLRSHNKQTSVVGLQIGFSKNYGGRFYHVMKLDTPTDNSSKILDACMLIFDRFYNNEPIRLVGVNLSGLVDKDSVQLNLFESIEEEEKESKKDKTIDEITSKYGKNSLVRASALLSDSTALERNKKIGGHNA